MAVIQRCSVIMDQMRSVRIPEVPAKSSKIWKHHLLSWFTLEDLSLMTACLVGVLEESKELEKEDFSKLFTLVAECAGLLISISGLLLCMLSLLILQNLFGKMQIK